MAAAAERPLASAAPALLALLAVLALSSCTATPGECDPTTGGLIGAVRCDASGSYDARIKQREDEHMSLISRKAALTREQQQLESEQQQLAADLKAKQAQDKTSQAQLAAVQRKLAAAKSEDAGLRQQAKSLEADIARNKTEMDALAELEARHRARLAELKKEQTALDAEYRASTGGG